ncbi:MAG: cytochrome P450 [Trueperaceae bacterium]
MRDLPPLPSPTAQPVAGHLGRWGRDPLALLREGAAGGEPFLLRLWRPAVVGSSPAWNRLVLGDLETFRSKGSLSELSPYLNGGVVMTDEPEHRPRRQELNPTFHARALAVLRERLEASVARHLPSDRFDALAWSLHAVPDMLNDAFFGGRYPEQELHAFFAPLHRPLPGPLLPRPLAFRRVNARLRALAHDPPDGSLIAHLAHLENVVEEVRVSLAAAFDTTAHTLAWALWYLAQQDAPLDAERIRLLIKETQRLHPAGWLGSRVSAAPFTFEGRTFPAGLLVFYSPYLTHLRTDLWDQPERFVPDRFEAKPPPWGYIPFSAGERICLGMHLAKLMMEVALAPFADGRTRVVGGDPSPRTGLTLSPRGPLTLQRD